MGDMDYGTPLDCARRGLALILEFGERFDLNPDRINVETMDVWSGTRCPLAQSGPGDCVDFGEIKHDMLLPAMGDYRVPSGVPWSPWFGFNTAGAYNEDARTALHDAWRVVLTEHRAS